MRSRWACTTSTGEIFFAAIMDARSVMEVQQRSLTRESPSLEDAVLRGGFGLGRDVVDGRQSRASGLDEGKQPGQLAIGQLEPLGLGQRAKRVDGELFH